MLKWCKMKREREEENSCALKGNYITEDDKFITKWLYVRVRVPILKY